MVGEDLLRSEGSELIVGVKPLSLL